MCGEGEGGGRGGRGCWSRGGKIGVGGRRERKASSERGNAVSEFDGGGGREEGAKTSRGGAMMERCTITTTGKKEQICLGHFPISQ